MKMTVSTWLLAAHLQLSHLEQLIKAYLQFVIVTKCFS